MSALPHAYFRKVLIHFGMDNAKAWAWFNQWQPGLNAIPMNLIRKGRIAKLEAFIDSHLAGPPNELRER